MITCDYGGGFGNKLFQYCFMRLMSEKLKLSLKTYPGKDVTDVIALAEQQPYRTYETIKHTICEDFVYDDLLKRDWENCGYHFTGFWQHADYYIQNRDLIKSFFLFEAPADTDKKNIVAHVRLGDYKLFGYRGNI
jgi:hypothetical protein